jgi:hypothetical protein
VRETETGSEGQQKVRLTPTCSSVNVAYCVRACAHIPPTVDMAEVCEEEGSPRWRGCVRSLMCGVVRSFISESSLPD